MNMTKCPKCNHHVDLHSPCTFFNIDKNGVRTTCGCDNMKPETMPRGYGAMQTLDIEIASGEKGL